VTIPANGDCTIDRIKSIDESVRAALRKKHVTVTIPGASGPVKRRYPRRARWQSRQWRNRFPPMRPRAPRRWPRMEELMGKAAEAGTTLEEKASEEYDTLEAEVGVIDKHLKRLLVAADGTGRAGCAVTTTVRTVEQGDARALRHHREDRAEVRPGIRFARLAKAKMLGPPREHECRGGGQAPLRRGLGGGRPLQGGGRRGHHALGQLGGQPDRRRDFGLRRLPGVSAPGDHPRQVRRRRRAAAAQGSVPRAVDRADWRRRRLLGWRRQAEAADQLQLHPHHPDSAQGREHRGPDRGEHPQLGACFRRHRPRCAQAMPWRR
jgi:hypothetical protein